MTAILAVSLAPPALSISASPTSLAWSSDSGTWKTVNINVTRLNTSGVAPVALTVVIVSGAAGTTLEGTTTINPGASVATVNLRNSSANTGTVRIRGTDATGKTADSAVLTLT